MKTRSLVLLPLRSNEIDINNKGIGYLLELVSRSEEREEELRLLLLVLSEEERLSVFPPETLLRLELLLRLGPEVLLLRPELLPRLVEVLLLSERLFLPDEELLPLPDGRLSFLLLVLELLLSQLGRLAVVLLPPVGLRSDSGRTDVEGREELPGRVVVPGRVDVPGREL